MVTVRQLGRATGGVVDGGIKKSLAVIVFLGVLLLWCLGMLLASRFLETWRAAAEVPAAGEASSEAPAPDAPGEAAPGAPGAGEVPVAGEAALEGPATAEAALEGIRIVDDAEPLEAELLGNGTHAPAGAVADEHGVAEGNGNGNGATSPAGQEVSVSETPDQSVSHSRGSSKTGEPSVR